MGYHSELTVVPRERVDVSQLVDLAAALDTLEAVDPGLLSARVEACFEENSLTFAIAVIDDDPHDAAAKIVASARTAMHQIGANTADFENYGRIWQNFIAYELTQV